MRHQRQDPTLNDDLYSLLKGAYDIGYARQEVESNTMQMKGIVRRSGSQFYVTLTSPKSPESQAGSFTRQSTLAIGEILNFADYRGMHPKAVPVVNNGKLIGYKYELPEEVGQQIIIKIDPNSVNVNPSAIKDDLWFTLAEYESYGIGDQPEPDDLSFSHYCSIRLNDKGQWIISSFANEAVRHIIEKIIEESKIKFTQVKDQSAFIIDDTNLKMLEQHLNQLKVNDRGKPARNQITNLSSPTIPARANSAASRNGPEQINSPVNEIMNDLLEQFLGSNIPVESTLGNGKNKIKVKSSYNNDGELKITITGGKDKDRKQWRDSITQYLANRGFAARASRSIFSVSSTITLSREQADSLRLSVANANRDLSTTVTKSDQRDRDKYFEGPNSYYASEHEQAELKRLNSQTSAERKLNQEGPHKGIRSASDPIPGKAATAATAASPIESAQRPSLGLQTRREPSSPMSAGRSHEISPTTTLQTSPLLNGQNNLSPKSLQLRPTVLTEERRVEGPPFENSDNESPPSSPLALVTNIMKESSPTKSDRSKNTSPTHSSSNLSRQTISSPLARSTDNTSPNMNLAPIENNRLNSAVSTKYDFDFKKSENQNSSLSSPFLISSENLDNNNRPFASPAPNSVYRFRDSPVNQRLSPSPTNRSLSPNIRLRQQNNLSPNNIPSSAGETHYSSTNAVTA